MIVPVSGNSVSGSGSIKFNICKVGGGGVDKRPW